MAFGRSNSLSLNTGAVNSSFAAQQQSQPQQGGGLFGGQGGTSQPQQGSSLFGGAQTPQPQQGGGSSLFGGGAQTQTSQPQASGSAFGGSLFGQQNQSSTQQNTQQTSGASGSSLFGGSLFGNHQQGQNQQGQNQQQSTQQQQPASGSLFGNSAFGGGQQNQTQQQNQNQQQQAAGGSMFGGGSLFGNQQQQQNNSTFGQNNNQQQPNRNSLFGTLGQSRQNEPIPQSNQASLLNASRYKQDQYQPFVTGRLTLGQGAAPPQTSTPATKLDWTNVRPTTRFNDLTDQAKEDLEKIEKLILDQEDLCRKIEAFMPQHEATVKTVGPDVQLITDKLAEVDTALSGDAHGVQQTKDFTTTDDAALARCMRIADSLHNPAPYTHHAATQGSAAPQQPPAWDAQYDTDLIGHYFHPLCADMDKLLNVYSGNLAEIESHVGTIEQSTVLQAQGLHAQRNGLGRGAQGPESVRQLADTLRGFEQSILAAAGQVGAAREGVNELVLGRTGGMGSRRY